MHPFLHSPLSIPDSLLSPLGDLEMDLSGDIPSIPQHLGLSVQNCSKPFNTDQVQQGSTKYSLVAPSSAKYSQVQPSTAKNSQVQPSTAKYSQVQPSTAKYS